MNQSPSLKYPLSNGEEPFSPTIACIENNVYVVWRVRSGNKIFLKRLIGGAVTEPNQIIVDNTTSSGIAGLAAAGNKIYVAWTQFTRPQYEAIFFRGGTDGGATFPRNPNTENMTYGIGEQHNPKIAVWKDLVFVIWSGNQSGLGDPDQYVVFAKSTDSGASFPSTYLVGGANYLADIAVSSIVTRPGFPPVVSVVWQDPSGIIYYRRSTDGGASFDPPLYLAAANASTSVVESYYDHTVHVAYEVVTSTQCWIAYARSTDYGASFEPPQILTRSFHIGKTAITAVENNVYVVWQGPVSGASTWKLLFRKSRDGGQTFDGEREVYYHDAQYGISLTAPKPFIV